MFINIMPGGNQAALVSFKLKKKKKKTLFCQIMLESLTATATITHCNYNS